jgi:cell division initiation protein
MQGMDSPQSALDSLRTVEFRETLKGYHRDDVDEYLEKAAVEAEGLQEQLRQSGERLRKAAEEIARLEAELAAKPAPTAVPAPEAAPAAADDSLQRTLILAQKFVDETKADAEAQAAHIVADAQAQASRIQTESEQRLRDEITRLEASRHTLTGEVESMSRQLEAERERLRSALTEMLGWVDGALRPAAAEAEAGSTVTNIAEAQRPANGDVTPLRPTGSSASLPL